MTVYPQAVRRLALGGLPSGRLHSGSGVGLLSRAQIEPFAWVVNACLAATGSTDPCLRQRIGGELQQIEVVRARHARRVAIVPWAAEEPVGPARLLAIARASASNNARATTGYLATSPPSTAKA